MASAKADAASKVEPEPAASQDVQDVPYSPSKNLTSDDEDAGLLDLTNLIGASSLAEEKVSWATMYAWKHPIRDLHESLGCLAPSLLRNHSKLQHCMLNVLCPSEGVPMWRCVHSKTHL